MKFLVTGGAGFIGSHYLKYVVNKYKEDEFVCIDSLTYAGNLDNIKEIMNESNFKFIKEDICNKEGIFSIFECEHFDYVIHFAAETHVDNSFNNEELFYRTNVEGTRVLLDACVKYGIKRFHYVSTDEVYGSIERNSNEVFTEESKLNPTNPYSKSKAIADSLVLEYNTKYSINVTISRSSNNYGINQYEEKLIPLVIKRIRNNELIPVYGDGLNIRDWLHVYDNCTAIDLIVHKGRNGEVYNISSYNELTNIEVVKLFLKAFNKDESLISYVKDRKIHDYKYTMSSEKIRNELGWEPKYRLEDSIFDIINMELTIKESSKKWRNL